MIIHDLIMISFLAKFSWMWYESKVSLLEKISWNWSIIKIGYEKYIVKYDKYYTSHNIICSAYLYTFYIS